LVLEEMLAQLTSRDIADVLSNLGLARYGTKAARISRLINTGASAIEILGWFRVEKLRQLSDAYGVRKGRKQDIIERLAELLPEVARGRVQVRQP
jgi:hypothetical protein